MSTIAYIANEFPSPLEPYVMDEIAELRRCGTQVICCSGKRVSPRDLSLAERSFCKGARYFRAALDEPDAGGPAARLRSAKPLADLAALAVGARRFSRRFAFGRWATR